ncbi:MAG: HEAT repeat domain-containing protein [Candidatus Melainabacteria bacterium]|nr:HEAT repeat domain-containing protein [Candidatus Melainabacteria bacterium]
MCTSSFDLLTGTTTRPSTYWLSYLSAGHPETPLHVLADLAHSADHTIRMRVAENKLTPVFIQRMLVNDSHPEVRSALAENPSVSEEILWKLAKDEDPIVRYELADNPRVALTVLVTLVNDENPYVSVRAEQTMEKIIGATQAQTAKKLQQLAA